MKLTPTRLVFICLLTSLTACSWSDGTDDKSSSSSPLDNKSSGGNPSRGEPVNRVNFSSQVPDPCQFKNLRDLPPPEVERVFATDKAKYENFQREYLISPETALKSWLISTSKFASAQSIDDFKLNKISERGVGHAGIYEVHLNQHPQDQLILKVSTHAEEAGHLWKLQNSIVGHPECFLNTKLGVNRVATQEELALFPKIPRILEAANFPFDSSKATSWYGGESRTHRYPILMEKVAGEALSALKIDQPETVKTHSAVGKSLGYFHYFMAENPSLPFEKWTTFTHGDLHTNNVFFDKSTNAVSFIDNDSMNKNSRLKYDFSQLAYQFFNRSINTGHSVLMPYISQLMHQEAKKRGMQLSLIIVGFTRPVPSGELHPQDAIIGALEDPTVIEQIPNSQAFQEVANRFSLFKAVTQGYIEAFPENRHQEVREYFGQFCRDTADSFMRYYSINQRKEDGSIEPRLDAALRQFLPADFIACMDENRFD